jgi:hypothetical protein
MHIKKLRLNGFKSYKETEVELCSGTNIVGSCPSLFDAVPPFPGGVPSPPLLYLLDAYEGLLLPLTSSFSPPHSPSLTTFFPPSTHPSWAQWVRQVQLF